MLGYVSMRIVLWIAGVIVSLFPTLYATGINNIHFYPYDTVKAINGDGNFRDLVFVPVVVSVLGSSLIVDFLLMKHNKVNSVLMFFVLILLIGNICALFAGLSSFINIPLQGKISNAQWLWAEYLLIWLALGIGLATEIVIGCANHHYP